MLAKGAELLIVTLAREHIQQFKEGMGKRPLAGCVIAVPVVVNQLYLAFDRTDIV